MRRNAFLVLLLVIYDSPTYDLTGLRTSKTVNGTTHNYLYASGKLLRETYGNVTLDFFYDSNGNAYAFAYNGAVYYYVTNLQGDVIRIINTNGTTVASYEYDPYGRIISATGDLAEVNPLRYRGYYYDKETGFYYLQSRYYDPNIGRFINADALASTGQGIIGNDMYAYCLNDPIMYADYEGTDAIVVVDENNFGHLGVLVQDENEKWWHFYWGTPAGGSSSGSSGGSSSSGSSSGSSGSLSKDRVKCLLGENVSSFTWCVEYTGDISVAAINKAGQYSGSYDQYYYFEGDFSKAISQLKNPGEIYNLYTNNCSQVSLRILASANEEYSVLFAEASKYLMPKNAGNYIGENR